MKEGNSLEAAGDVVGIGVSELPVVHLGLGVHLCQEDHLRLEVHPYLERQEGQLLLAKCCVQLKGDAHVAWFSVVIS